LTGFDHHIMDTLFNNIYRFERELGKGGFGRLVALVMYGRIRSLRRTSQTAAIIHNQIVQVPK